MTGTVRSPTAARRGLRVSMWWVGDIVIRRCFEGRWVVEVVVVGLFLALFVVVEIVAATSTNMTTWSVRSLWVYKHPSNNLSY
jgi:hypothetical protein